MAQSIDTIQAQQMDYLVAALAALGYTLDPTQLADEDTRQLLTYVTAMGMGIEQQLWDAYRDDIEAISASIPPQTGLWFQKKMLEFQYNAINPQVLVLDPATVTFKYPTVNPAYQVIKFAKCVPGAFGTTLIKIADATTSAMSAPIVAAAQAYANVIGVPGLRYTVTSLDADRIYIQAQINYRGEYSAVIQSNVIIAITNYLEQIPFNGIVDLTDLTVIIRAVPGVLSVLYNNVRARPNAVAFGGGTTLVMSNTFISNYFQTVAGKIVPETDVTHTLADSLTFIPS